jgi:hypothetical protein
MLQPRSRGLDPNQTSGQSVNDQPPSTSKISSTVTPNSALDSAMDAGTAAMGNTDHSGDRDSNSPSVRKVDIQHELNKIEEMILDSPRVPLTGRTLIDEEPILDVLDLVRLNLPTAFQAAEDVLRQKDEILRQAEQYGRDVVEAAEKQAISILDEMGLVRQAKAEADRIREQIKADCDAAQERTMAEIERMHQQAKHEAEELKMRALAEARSIEAGADEYAERVLQMIEQQLSDMMRVVHNGRTQLQQDASYRAHRQEALHQAQQLQQAQNTPGSGAQSSSPIPPHSSRPS